MSVIAGIAGLVVLGLMLWVRLAPTDIQRWHREPLAATHHSNEAGALRVIDGGQATFAHLDTVIRATARTRYLAGSLDEGMMTYVTRSLVFGFPDFTTIRVIGNEQIIIVGRPRFGSSDFGVNAARMDGWIAQLGGSG